MPPAHEQFPNGRPIVAAETTASNSVLHPKLGLFDSSADRCDGICVNHLANFSAASIDNEVTANGRIEIAVDKDFL